MAKKDAERLIWAVETLAVDPSDHILEIGCGAGVAVTLVSEKLEGGKVMAIDRSEAMIAQARKRNQHAISSGKVVFQAAALHQADFGGERFNKVFAFHVSSLWKQPARDLGMVKRVLRPGGMLFLFSQLPFGKEMQMQEFASMLARVVKEHGFSLKEVVVKDMKPMPAVCIIAAM
jgi:ubiquinone/menaquinone biosynthesis C-methylase UbiE